MHLLASVDHYGVIVTTTESCGLSAFRKMFGSFISTSADEGHNQMARRIRIEKKAFMALGALSWKTQQPCKTDEKSML